MRLTIVASHPVQYQAPLFRELARRCDLHVLFSHKATASDQAAAGFNVAFEWDVDLTSGFDHSFMMNVARNPGLEEFAGCDTPMVGDALSRLGPDAVVLMGWHLKCYWQAILACRRAGYPIMVRGDSHLETPRSRLKRTGKALIYPLALRAFDAALYVGEQSRRYWVHYRYPTERMFFSPHCVDSDWFAARATPEERARVRRERGIGGDAKVVLFAGKLVPFKRPLDVIDAASRCRLAGMPVEVMIAGSGDLDPEIRRQAGDAGVPLHMLGFCNQSEMPAAYAAADVLILPSNGGETWGLVANEALACGKPIIVSDECGCAADLAADGQAGKVFRCGDMPELARTLWDTLADPPTPGAIIEKSSRYGVGVAAAGIIDAVRVIAATPHRRRSL